MIRGSIDRGEFARFCVVGALCSALNFAVMYAATDVAKFHYLVSTALSFFLVNLVGFFLNKLLAFRRSHTPPAPELLRYYGVMLLSLGLNLVMMYVLVTLAGLWYLWASVVITMALLLLNFLLHKHFSFGGA